MEDFILESLLNGPPFRVRVLRFFFCHPEHSFSVKEVAKSTNVRRPLITKEFKQLQKIGLLKKVGKKTILNPTFFFLDELRVLATKTSPSFRQELKRMILKISPVKFLVFSGIFFSGIESEVDILVVAEKFNSKKLSM